MKSAQDRLQEKFEKLPKSMQDAIYNQGNPQKKVTKKKSKKK